MQILGYFKNALATYGEKIWQWLSFQCTTNASFGVSTGPIRAAKFLEFLCVLSLAFFLLLGNHFLEAKSLLRIPMTYFGSSPFITQACSHPM